MRMVTFFSQSPYQGEFISEDEGSGDGGDDGNSGLFDSIIGCITSLFGRFEEGLGMAFEGFTDNLVALKKCVDK